MSELDQKAIDAAIVALLSAEHPYLNHEVLLKNNWLIVDKVRAGADHSGDCTDECHTRLVCLVGDYEAKARAAITAYLAARREQGWVILEKADVETALVRVIEIEREACAQIADAYADENITMAGDSVLHDPVLSGEPLTGANVAKSKDLMIEGCIHSSMFHASQNIAAAIRSRTKADLT